MTAGSLLRISAHLRAGAGVALLAFAATAAPSPAGAFSTDAAAAAQAAAATAGPVSTAATGARCIGPAFDDTPAFQAAIDTGHTVYAPALGGQCHITHALVMRTPGQIFHGDGRARTKIVIEPGFTGEGVFVAKTGEPGPVWRDFSVSFVQPENPSLLRPPAFKANDTPRFVIDFVGCYAAAICVDMQGNSGGASISNLEFSSFWKGIIIDGSLDNVRLTNVNWWQFALSAEQVAVFNGNSDSCPIGIAAARVDGLIISNSLFAGCLGIKVTQTVKGFGTGSLTNVDFDGNSGFEMSSGAFSIIGGSFAVGNIASQAIRVHSGSLLISGTSFLVAKNVQKALIETSAIIFSMNNVTFAMGSTDATAITQTGGVLMLANTSFMRDPDKAYDAPTLKLVGGRSLISTCYASDKGRNSGVFAKIDNDNPLNQTFGNITPGWQMVVPLHPTGSYEPSRSQGRGR